MGGAVGCATTGATFGSGVGDRFLEEPPYYAGSEVPAGMRIVHLPLSFQPDPDLPASFRPSSSAGSPLAALLDEMNAYLSALLGSPAMGPGTATEGATVWASELPGVPPDVRFGCEAGPWGECDREVAEADGGGALRMHLAVGRPSSEWREAFGSALAAEGADAALLLTLEVSDYWVHQRDLLGRKEVRLGTWRVHDLPLLTSLDDPVQVLQLTGALVRSDGRAIRIGAEGLLVRRTPFLASAFGFQALVTDDEVEALRTPEGALVWRDAMESLVAELAGRAVVAPVGR